MSSVFLSPVLLFGTAIDITLFALAIWLAVSGHNSNIWSIMLVISILMFIAILGYVRVRRHQAKDPESDSGVTDFNLDYVRRNRSFASTDSSTSDDGVDRSSIRSGQRTVTNTPRVATPTLVGIPGDTLSAGRPAGSRTPIARPQAAYTRPATPMFR